MRIDIGDTHRALAQKVLEVAGESHDLKDFLTYMEQNEIVWGGNSSSVPAVEYTLTVEAMIILNLDKEGILNLKNK